MRLSTLIDESVTKRLNQLNTNTLCTVINLSPLEILPIYGDKTKIESPLKLKDLELNTGDTVLVSYIQEVCEDGCTRFFDPTDAVIIGVLE